MKLGARAGNSLCASNVPARLSSGGHPARDQESSEFSAILQAFLVRVPGARAAVLVDSEGEAVDYAGHVDPFALRVAAAHFRLVLQDVHSQPSLRGATSFVVRAARRSFLVHAIAEGYALFVQFCRGGGLSGWYRALAVCVHHLSAEAGWKSVRPMWFAVEISADERRRPLVVKVGRTERKLEVLGALASSGPGRERAWRVRAETGVEAMLVREPGGVWYADEALA